MSDERDRTSSGPDDQLASHAGAAVAPPFPSVPEILAAIRAGYGFEATALEEIDSGADAAARAWRVAVADGPALFLKLRHGVRPAAILLPRHLTRLGMPEPVAALSTSSGAGWLDIGGWTAVVMPLIEGPSALEAGLDLDGWRDLGRFAARLHAARLPGELAAVLGVERFGPEATVAAHAVDALIDRLDPAVLDAHSLAVRDGWLAWRPEIRRLIALSEALTASILARDATDLPTRLVPCHADLHAGNILLEAGRRIRIVDWDESVLAPPERDLMFVRGSVVAGRVTDEQADAFEAGYGRFAVDRELLAHYRVDWAVQDVTSFAWEVLVRPDRMPSTRPLARRRFLGQFDPGGQVEAAFEIAGDLTLS